MKNSEHPVRRLAGDGIAAALLWVASVAAWCGYGFDPDMTGTGTARIAMALLLLTGGAWTLRQTFFSPTHEPEGRKWFRILLTFSGLGLLAAGLYWPDRPFRMYVTPKMVLLYPVSVVLFAWWAWHWTNASVRRALASSPLTWLFAGMAVHLLVNTAVSGMPAVTFFGSANRQMGAVTVYACMASALAASLWIARDRDRALLFLRGWLAIGVVLSLRAFYELDMPGVQYFRAFGFAGNPDYFALQFHFTLLPALVLYFSEPKVRWAAFYAAVAAFNVYALAILQTRGAFLGAGVASFAGMLAFSPARHLEIPHLRRRLLALLGVLAAGFAVYYLYVGMVLPPETELAKLPPDRAAAVRDAALGVLARRVSTAIFVLFAISPMLLRAAWDALPQRRHRLALSGALALAAALVLALPAGRAKMMDIAHKAVRIRTILDPAEGDARFRVWKDTLPMVRDHFLTGVGRETYRVRFLPYKSFELTTMAPTVNYRSSHNIVLDTLVLEGVAGLFLLLAMAAFGIAASVRAARQSPQDPASPVLMGLGLAITGYMAHEMVIYDVIPTIFSFYIALGMVGGLLLKIQSKEKTQPISPWIFRAAVLLTAAGVLWVSVHMVRHARTDLALAGLQKHAATLRGYQKAADGLAKERQRIKSLENALHSPMESGDAEKLRAVLASAGVDARRMPPDAAGARTWVQNFLQRMQMAVQEKERQLDAKMGESVREAARKVLQALREMLLRDAPSENLYNASHAASVLARLPDAYLTPPGRIEVLQLLLEAARRGVQDNTNPESAYSRLFSSEYALARALEDTGRKEEARVHFLKCEEALQKSIDFDRLYYDTHRLKAVLLLERYCDAKGARGEIDTALRILKASRPSKELQDVIAGIEKGLVVQLRSLEENPELLRACRARAGIR